MSVSNYLLSGYKLKKARKLAALARTKEGGQADQLFKQAYENFSAISTARARYPDALHDWGLALFNQSQTKSGDECIKLIEEAISKFNLCDTVQPNHIGACLDGGVALMGLAKAKGLSVNDDLYNRAKEKFLTAENVQKGSSSFNLACMFALQNKADDCLTALEKARDFGLVPEEQDIIDDPDLDNIKQLSWFKEFLESLDVDDTHYKEVPESIDESKETEVTSDKSKDSAEKSVEKNTE